MWPSYHGLCSNARNVHGKAYLSIQTYILYGIILEFQNTFDVGLKNCFFESQESTKETHYHIHHS